MNPLCYVLSFSSRFRQGSRNCRRLEETYYRQVYIHHKTYGLGLKWSRQQLAGCCVAEVSSQNWKSGHRNGNNSKPTVLFRMPPFLNWQETVFWYCWSPFPSREREWFLNLCIELCANLAWNQSYSTPATNRIADKAASTFNGRL